MPSDSPPTWISTDPSTEGTIVRAVAFLAIMVLAFLLAVAFRGALRGGARQAGPATRRILGRPEPPAPWARGEWVCARCRSISRPASTRCDRCRTPRAVAEVLPPAAQGVPDIIPAEVPAAPPSVVMLEHNAAAHLEGLAGHWRLRVNNVIVGSAARRDGALALLRAVTGAETVLFDRRGDGYAPMALAALIAAFEGPRLPIRAPCPEADATPR